MTPNLARYERIAPFYDLLDLPFERHRYHALRPLLFQNLKGRLLDAGIGTGRNCAFYPPETIVSGIDTSPAMLERARRRCPTLSAGGRLYRMDVTALKFPAASFDAAVATFLFCVLARELAGPGAAGTWSRGQAGRPYSAPRICPTARHPTADRLAAVGSLDRLGLWRKFRSADRAARPGGRP